MEEILKSRLSQFIAFILTLLAIFTVNSTCYICLGQAKEPESLKRLKKH